MGVPSQPARQRQLLLETSTTRSPGRYTPPSPSVPSRPIHRFQALLGRGQQRGLVSYDDAGTNLAWAEALFEQAGRPLGARVLHRGDPVISASASTVSRAVTGFVPPGADRRGLCGRRFLHPGYLIIQAGAETR